MRVEGRTPCSYCGKPFKSLGIASHRARCREKYLRRGVPEIRFMKAAPAFIKQELRDLLSKSLRLKATLKDIKKIRAIGTLYDVRVFVDGEEVKLG